MTSKRVLIIMLVMIGFFSGLDAAYRASGLPQSLGWNLSLELALNFLGFAWYRYDSDARHYIRSRWLNVCIVGLMPFAVPYYLVRSRQRGEKLRAIFKCAGFAFLMLLASAVGVLLGRHAV
ncbi:hypothetical protein [Massilia horti]|uniref:Uncharacterized protein n=1 Tax=Massilia horti TaxID=2562153 RepID=A0A4Y9T1T6_9BURK|nr:hypothetical protein [Massilia horti]TFW32960.1 hypothetical protein E4O92_08535 [Massilia horti]